MNSDMKTHFWGASIEILLNGLTHIAIPGYDEIYSISRPSTLVNNLVFGEMYLEHIGEMIVK